MVKVKLKNKKAFSLMEVVFYMVLVGILIGIAVPNLGKLKEKAELTVIKADTGSVRNMALLEGIDSDLPVKDNSLKQGQGKLYLNGELVDSLDISGFYEVKDPIYKDSGTKLDGGFYINDNYDVVYVDDVDHNDVEYASESDFMKKNGNWVYVGTDKVVKIPYELGGEKLTSYSRMFEGTDVEKVVSDNPNITDTSSMFSRFNGKVLDLSGLSTVNVTNMSGMFGDASNIEKLSLSNFNTENVTNMSSMFKNMANLKELNISSFKTQKVENMSYMFRGCENLEKLNISNFNTENVKNMNSLFRDCKKLTELNLSNFSTKNVSNMTQLFSYINIDTLDLRSFEFADDVEIKSLFNGSTTKKVIVKDDKYVNMLKNNNNNPPGIIFEVK